MSVIFAKVHHINYPGGVLLHKLMQLPSHKKLTTVFIDNKAAMTGVTKFGMKGRNDLHFVKEGYEHANMHFSTTKNLHRNVLTRWWHDHTDDFDYMITERDQEAGYTPILSSREFVSISYFPSLQIMGRNSLYIHKKN